MKEGERPTAIWAESERPGRGGTFTARLPGGSAGGLAA